MYINDLPESLSSDVKLFPDKISNFSVVSSIQKSAMDKKEVLKWLANGQTSGKWDLTPIYLNNLKKWFSEEK